MRIAIHARKISAASIPYLKIILAKIEHANAHIFISEICIESNKKNKEIDWQQFEVIKNTDELKSMDFFFSLGGDGTLLESVSLIGNKEIPILGINLGTLGFLATTAKNDIDSALSLFFDGEYTFDSRSLIHLDSDVDIFGDQDFALNEVAILKRDTASMIVIHCYINGEFVNTYWADGLMVSTPTGSTGYSLSCGGPLVLPQSDNFIITPVSPHNLNVRPMIVPGNSEISFEVEGKGRSFLISLDSRSHTVDNSMKFSMRKENFNVKLVKIKGSKFFDTLRSKLNWGKDVRN
jgi:NAD+ kinase